MYDLIIVGAGPAGMMAAIRAAERGLKVLILEKNSSAGKKLLICGNGRCNVTNAEKDPAAFCFNYMKNPKFMISMLHNYSNLEVMEFFESAGVALKVEPGLKVFPKSNKARDFLDALLNRLIKLKVDIIYETPVEELLTSPHPQPLSQPLDYARGKRERGAVIRGVKTPKGEFLAPNVLLSTGGKTKQRTGSTGDGFRFAESLGHKIIPPKKALYPFEVKEVDICRKLNGLSVEAEVSFINRTGLLFKDRGPIMFANFGLTGPTMINASLNISNAQMSGFRVSINFFPGLDEKKVDELLVSNFAANPNKDVLNSLFLLLPKSLPPVMLEVCGIAPDIKVHDLTKEQRKQILKQLTELSFTISNYVIVNKSIATDGGIDLKEIDNKTLGSKMVKGLYFAGEILDVIGKTGGFNLQAAWSTGWTAGNSVGGGIIK